MHVFVFSQHSRHWFHFFSAAKFAIPIATVPFVLAPVTLLAALGLGPRRLSLAAIRARWTGRAMRPRWSFIAPPLVALAAWYAVGQAPRIVQQFQPVDERGPIAIGQFIAQHTGYADVVFTPDPTLETISTSVLLAQSMKRVYLARDLAAIHERLKAIDGEYRVAYLVAPGLWPQDPGIQRLRAAANASAQSDDLVLYTIAKADFLAACRAQDVAR